jgi:hypothetical protein
MNNPVTITPETFLHYDQNPLLEFSGSRTGTHIRKIVNEKTCHPMNNTQVHCYDRDTQRKKEG